MLIYNIESGSKGNATLFISDYSVILIDMGIGKRLLASSLKEFGFEWDDLKDVFITHSHNDHIGGLCYVKYSCNIYAREGALNGSYTPLEDFEQAQVGPFVVTCLPTSHDAPSACGYLIEAEGKKVGYITDTGRLKKDVLKVLKGADAYIFESNHDLDLLMRSSRPAALKKRIASTKGHLSNAKAGNYLKDLIGPKTKWIALAHLSEECNTPELALVSVRIILMEAGLDLTDIDLLALSQRESTRLEI